MHRALRHTLTIINQFAVLQNNFMHCACDADDANAFLNRNACFHSAVNALTAEAINLYAFALGSADLNNTAFGNNFNFHC